MDCDSSAADAIKYTTCSGHCLNVCLLKVRIRDGVIVSIEPDDTVNPELTRDYEQLPEEAIDAGMVQRRPCAKGYSWLSQLYDPKRITYPMKRVGERGEGKFERITWDEAIDTIATKLVETKEKYGPYSIMHHPYSLYGTCSFPLAPWFGAGFTCWQNHSCAGWEQPRVWVLGKDPYVEWLGGTPNDLVQDELNMFDSKLIVLWGMNVLATWGGGVANNLLRAKKRGIPIIVIDPRYTPTAEVLADQWIPIRPTTDVAMMIAMANVWFKEDLCDHEFIAKHVEPEGLERWKAHVLGQDDGIDKTPQWAEGICGVPAETIEAFARLYAGSKPVNLNSSLTLGRQFYGENAARASMYLQALTGNSCLPGGTAAADTGLWMGKPGTRKWPVPYQNWSDAWGQSTDAYVAPTLMELHKWAKSIDLREKLDSGEMSTAEYNNQIGNTPDSPAPNIKLLFMESNNHVGTLPEMNATIRAMKKLDFSVVWTQYADLDSARYADIILPLGHMAFEGKNEHFWGMWWAWDNCFILRQKCVDPPGEVRPVDWFWMQLAKKLGLAEQYNPRMADVPHNKWHDALQELDREAYEKWALLPEIVPLNPPTWAEFLKKPIFRFDMSKDPHYPFKVEMEAGENPFKGTASGKLEFYSELLAKGPEFLAKNEALHGNRCYGGGNLPAMAQMVKGGKDTFFSKNTEKYPLLMSSPHAYFRVHSWLDNNPLLRDDCYRHAVWMSVPDAKAREVKDNDLVRIFSDIAEMIIPAYVTSRIVPGTVAIHHGAWYRPGAEKSELMPDGVDRGGSPNLFTHNQDLPDTVVGFYPCKGLVQIEKWEGA